MRKFKHLMIILGIYILAFALGYLSCFVIENTILKYFVFDLVATVVTFIFSLIFKNSSVYDAYWSFTPMVMSIYLMIEYQAYSIWQILVLVAFNIWSIRLTINWITVFTDFSYEDWRYTKYRNENKPFMWFIINFFGIHLVPTLVVFAGMLPLFDLVLINLDAWSLIGVAVILMGTSFEFFADRHMHKFLRETKERKVCKVGLWNYSRHPNYLGEMTVWVGVALALLPYIIQQIPELHWYFLLGPIPVIILFNVVSIPLMEKRQISRRPDYANYQKTTHRLFILPHKKAK